MSEPEWKDTTSWSQSDSAETRKTPRCWTLKLPKSETELTLHRHIHSPGSWFVTCRKIGLDTYQLASRGVDAAKDEAIAAAREKVAFLQAEFAEILEQL